MQTLFSGFMQGKFDKKYLDQIKTAVNSNAGKISTDSNGKGFNVTVNNKYNDTGTLYILKIYDTDGKNVTYTDKTNNTYYLCASYTVKSAVPIPINPGTLMKYIGTNSITITFFGQYFGIGHPPPGNVVNVSPYYAIDNGNYYQLWADIQTTKAPIGNPSFSINTSSLEANQQSDVSLYLNSITNNGIYLKNPMSMPNNLIDTYDNVAPIQDVSYSAKSVLTIGYGDISSTNTNIFTNPTNTSKTYKNMNSKVFDTTFYKDYNSKSTGQESNSACYFVLNVETQIL